MRTSPLFCLLAASLAFLGIACASPTTAGDDDDQGATAAGESAASSGKGQAVSGMIDSSAPNLHVALVWRAGRTQEWIVAGDAKVENKRFSIAISAPPERAVMTYFDHTTPAPPPSAGGIATQAIMPKGSELMIAYAGLVAYEDKNGNGALDLDAGLKSTADHLVAGSSPVSIAWLSGGSYDDAKDHVGLVPHEGLNVDNDGTWVGPTGLKLDAYLRPALASHVCGFETFWHLPDSFVNGLCTAMTGSDLPSGGAANPPPSSEPLPPPPAELPPPPPSH